MLANLTAKIQSKANGMSICHCTQNPTICPAVCLPTSVKQSGQPANPTSRRGKHLPRKAQPVLEAEAEHSEDALAKKAGELFLAHAPVP